MTRDFNEAMERFLGRLNRAGKAGEAAPVAGQWSAAQIAWHVALVNEAFAALMSGAIKGTAPAPSGFVERDWQEVRMSTADRLEASPRVQPPPGASMAESLTRLRASADRVRAAIAALTPERGSGFTLQSPIVGEISVYQIAEWATAHVIRHNAQAKRVLGG
jgi:uncharacterized damage-inducible protein DinB